jgi:hypothetical protein
MEQSWDRESEIRIGSRDSAILTQRAKDKAARREIHKKRQRPKSAHEIQKAAKKAAEIERRDQAREIIRNQNSLEAAAQPTSERFVSRSDATQERLAEETVGFMNGGEFAQKRKAIEVEEKQKRKAETKRIKGKKKPQLRQLSFGDDYEEDTTLTKPVRPKVSVNPDAQNAVKIKEGSSDVGANLAAAKKLRATLLLGA